MGDRRLRRRACRLSPTTIGVLLSVSSLLGFVGAAIPSHPASHKHRLALIWAAQLR